MLGATPEIGSRNCRARDTGSSGVGIVTHVLGRMLGTEQAVSGATVEICQCDAHGRYLHPAETGKRPRDSAARNRGAPESCLQAVVLSIVQQQATNVVPLG